MLAVGASCNDILTAVGHLNNEGKLGQANSNLVGVISAGSAIEMPWHHYFKALLYCNLSGQAGAGATLDILAGKTNPSGKLSETIPRRLEDTSCYRYYPSQERNSEYRESIYNMPFRAMAKMTGGVVDMEMVQGIVKIVNGHFFVGLCQVVRGYFRNSRQNKAYEKELR